MAVEVYAAGSRPPGISDCPSATGVGRCITGRQTRCMQRVWQMRVLRSGMPRYTSPQVRNSGPPLHVSVVRCPATPASEPPPAWQAPAPPNKGQLLVQLWPERLRHRLLLSGARRHSVTGAASLQAPEQLLVAAASQVLQKNSLHSFTQPAATAC